MVVVVLVVVMVVVVVVVAGVYCRLCFVIRAQRGNNAVKERNGQNSLKPVFGDRILNRRVM